MLEVGEDFIPPIHVYTHMIKIKKCYFLAKNYILKSNYKLKNVCKNQMWGQYKIYILAFFELQFYSLVASCSSMVRQCISVHLSYQY